jgi:hypothetical protein
MEFNFTRVVPILRIFDIVSQTNSIWRFSGSRLTGAKALCVAFGIDVTTSKRRNLRESLFRQT